MFAVRKNWGGGGGGGHEHGIKTVFKNMEYEQ